MIKQSKEYIKAMDGVLNGEKWTRSKWQIEDGKDFIAIVPLGLVYRYYLTNEYPAKARHRMSKNYAYGGFVSHKEHLTATDWVKVEEND